MMGLPLSRQTLLSSGLQEQFVARDNYPARGLRSRTTARCSHEPPSTPSGWLSNCPMVICDLRGSLFHSVIVSETGSSSLNKPSRVAASAATPQKLLVPLKIGHLSRADPPLA